jgi:hypothetical protein
MTHVYGISVGRRMLVSAVGRFGGDSGGGGAPRAIPALAARGPTCSERAATVHVEKGGLDTLAVVVGPLPRRELQQQRNIRLGSG